MRATLPAGTRFSALGVADAHPLRPRRSLGGRPNANPPFHAGYPCAAANTGGSSSSCSNAGTAPGAAAAATVGPIGQALLNRVNSLASKLDVILGDAGKRIPPLPNGRMPTSLGERLVDLTERLSRLELLLDEGRSRGIFNPPPAPEPAPLPQARYSFSGQEEWADAAAEASVRNVARSLLAAMQHAPNESNGQKLQGMQNPALQPGMGMYQALPPQASHGAWYEALPPGSYRQQSTSRATTPLPSSRVQTPGRFVEIHRPSVSGALPAGGPCAAATAARPYAAERSFAAGSGGLTPPAGLNAPAGLRTPSLTPAPLAAAPPAVPQPPMLPVPIRGMESLAQSASRHLNGAKTPLAGAGTPRVSAPGFSPGPLLAHRAAAAAAAANAAAAGANAAAADGRFSPAVPLPFAALVQAPSRNQSVSRNASVAPGGGSSAASQPPSPCLANATVRPQTPSMGGLQNATANKIRQWLSTIPIGNGSERGWDDAQIVEIARFAEEQHIENLSPEEVYRRYVEHLVDEAEAKSQ